MPLDAAALASNIDVSGRLPLAANLDEFRTRAEALSAETGWNLYYGEIQRRMNELAAAYVAEASLLRYSAGATGWRRLLLRQLQEILEQVRPKARIPLRWARICCAISLPTRISIELMRRCGPRLADVAQGRADGVDVLFTGDGYAQLEQFYKEAPGSAYYNALTANLVAEFAPAFDGVRLMRVLEVGAGTGGTTAHILPRLNVRNTSYVFTDVSPLFLDRARAKFSHEYPFLSTRLFDITRSASAQGFEAGSFDLILAVNVLHATPEVKPCVERLRDLLAPRWRAGVGGGHQPPCRLLLLDIIFGLMEGWWKFEG